MPVKRPAARPSAEGYPSLRSAMCLYCLVLIGSIVVATSLYNIDVVFLRLVSSIFITAGFTAALMFTSRIRPTAIFGERPTTRQVILSLLIGLFACLPSFWIMTVFYAWLYSAVGPLPYPFTDAPASMFLLEYSLVVPLAQGLLFWAFIQRAAEGLSRVRGALLAAVLYATYGLFTHNLTTSSMPGLLIVGLLAAFAVYTTRSAWCGIALTATYGVLSALNEMPPAIQPIFWQQIMAGYFGNQSQATNPFSVRWLLLVAVTGFIAFILFQILRVTAAARSEQTLPRSAPKLLWWLPLVISVLLLAVGVYGEMVTRLSYGQYINQLQRAPTAQRTATTVPGQAPPVQVPKAPSQTPQGADQQSK
jgi:hypothetical protein